MSYAKVHEEYWDGEKIEPLSDRAALLGLFLLTGPHRNAIGCFRLGTGAITDIPRFGGWGIEGVSKALLEMVETGFIVRDERTGWTLIVNYLKKDPINNPKAAIHAAALADRVPKNTAVYQRLRAILEPQLEAYSEPLTGKPGYPMASPIEAPSKGHNKPHRSPLPSPSPEPNPTSSLRSDGATSRAVAVADATSEVPLKEKLFGPCLQSLARRSDKPPDKIRSMIGRWCSQHGDGATLDAIALSERAAAVDPIAWIEKHFRNAAGKRAGSDDSDRLLSQLDLAEQH